MNFDPQSAANPRPEEDNVLFLYAANGGGHKECADAIAKTLAARDPSRGGVGLDAITYLYPILGPVIAKTYFEILKYTPQIWNFLYDNPDIESVTRELRELFSFLDNSKLKTLLTQYRPAAFVCTHAIPCGLIAQQKKKGKCSLPLVGVVTDFAVHSYWIYPEVDLYVVANRQSEETLLARGVPGSKIKVCGIPTDPEFNFKTDRRLARARLGLDPNKPVVLVMGGARGMGPIPEIVKEVLSLRPAPQVVVLTGTNRELREEMAHLQKLESARIQDYTREVPLFMDAADLLISKPGGITSSEALIKKLPMILAEPIPGQEERNARYLVENGAAIEAKEIAQLKDAVKSLLSGPGRRNALSESAGKISTPLAADLCAEELIRLLSLHQEQVRASRLERV